MMGQLWSYGEELLKVAFAHLHNEDKPNVTDLACRLNPRSSESPSKVVAGAQPISECGGRKSFHDAYHGDNC